MRKRFFRTSILVQAVVGGALGLLLVVPSFNNFAAHPVLSWIGIAVYLLLIPTLGMIIEAKMK